MSYKVFARKWRPLNFAQVVGQEHIVRALVNALEHDRLHHAYLFTGTRGVGKTTIARVLAKALNCEAKVAAEPCCKCQTCLNIDQGHYPDLIEVDAASRTGVDDTRDLLENVQYAPTIGKYKVYLIDEVHMFSKSSFNALLKTLEEPPEHVKFLLATTDPQKMPVTVLSRCLQFNLKRLLPEQIEGQFKRILESEGINYQPQALGLLSAAADGSMRDGLSLLDQAIVHGNGELNETDVLDMLGSVAREPVLDVLNALISGDGQTVLEAVQKLDEFAPDYAEVLQLMLSFLHKIALYQIVATQDVDERIPVLAKALSKEDIQLYYQIALVGQKDLPLAPSPKMGFEMVLLRMLAFRPVDAVTVAPQEQASTVAVPAASSVSVAVEAATQAPTSTPSIALKKPSLVVPKITIPEKKTLEKIAKPKLEAPTKQNKVNINQVVAGDESRIPVVKSVEKSAALINDRNWHEIVPKLGLDPITLQLANNVQLTSLTEKSCELTITAGYISVNSRGESRLKEALSVYYGRAMSLTLKQSAEAIETPNAIKDEKKQQRLQQAVEEIANNPAVKKLQELFGAKIVEGSIRPLD